jgi:hypothetical protein
LQADAVGLALDGKYPAELRVTASEYQVVDLQQQKHYERYLLLCSTGAQSTHVVMVGIHHPPFTSFQRILKLSAK